MYLHDRGSATNEEIGFHKFLEGFIGLKLPEIINQEGKRVKLYLPLLSSCHFIEQKSGWSDFFANIPYYSIREASSKVFEYILNMDVFETAAVRQELQNKFRENEEKWKLQVDKIKTTVKRGGGEMVGLSEMPEIMSKEIKPYSRFYRGDKLLLLDEILNNIENESAIIDSEINQPLTKNLEKVQANLFELKDITERYENFYESLSSEINQEKERLRQYGHQLTNVNEDLKKNKDALKISNLGLNANFKIASGFCPTCNQTINDSLLNSNVVITPMRIDENISYLNAQEKMIHAFVNNLRSTILEKETKLASVEEAIQNNRQRIRALRKDLVSDDRLPSRELIERKVIIEREASLLNRLKEEIADGVTILYKLSKEFEKLRGEEKRLPQYYHSDNDNEKIIYFQDSFKRLINLFGFKSKPVDSIKISSEKYTPVYEIILDNGMKRFVDIRFESSASDFIRAQWAYYTSLMSTSIAKSGNHFLTLLFDEPQQQSAATVNFKAFLKELEKFKNEQVIVLASFQNSTEEYMDAISELSSFNEIDFAKSGGLIIEKLGN